MKKKKWTSWERGSKKSQEPLEGSSVGEGAKNSKEEWRRGGKHHHLGAEAFLPKGEKRLKRTGPLQGGLAGKRGGGHRTKKMRAERGKFKPRDKSQS